MNIFLNRDGSCQKVSPSRIYQGSANVSTITVIAPFNTQSALSIAFSLPNGTRTTYQGMSFAPANQAGASDGIFFWTYKIPFAVTEYAGTVGVSINVVSATNNQTSYLCTFEVEESIVPTVPAEPTETTWEALLVLYQQNAAAIAAFADSKVPIGDISVETLPTGENAEVSVAWDETDSEIDFSFKIPQGPQGIAGNDGLDGATGLTGPQGDTGVSLRFRGAWTGSSSLYRNDNVFIDCVTYNGALYICKIQHTSTSGMMPPSATSFWNLAANGIISAVANGMDIVITFSDGTTSTITIGNVVATIGVSVDTVPTSGSANLVTSGGVSSAIKKVTPYDLVIKTQADFDAMLASPTWLDAVSVAIVGRFVYSVANNSGIKIPNTVRQIHGLNSAEIEVQNFSNNNTSNGALYYEYGDGGGSLTNEKHSHYSVMNLRVRIGSGGGTLYPHNVFYNISGLYNCSATSLNSKTIGFSWCRRVSHCTSNLYYLASGYAYENCTLLDNCVAEVSIESGGTASCFKDITLATSCRGSVSAGAVEWSGTNQGIDINTCKKTLSTADNATLNT